MKMMQLPVRITSHSWFDHTVCAQVIVLEDRPEYFALLSETTAQAMQRSAFDTLVIINPRLTSVGDQGARFFEGCLSVPGYQVGQACKFNVLAHCAAVFLAADLNRLVSLGAACGCLCGQLHKGQPGEV